MYICSKEPWKPRVNWPGSKGKKGRTGKRRFGEPRKPRSELARRYDIFSRLFQENMVHL